MFFRDTFCNFAFIMNIRQKRYLQYLSIGVVVLAMARCVFPSIAEAPDLTAKTDADSSIIEKTDSMDVANDVENLPVVQPYKYNGKSRFFYADGSLVKNRIYSVPHFGNTFPDQNDVQLLAANKHGVKAVVDRADAEKRKSELVYVGSNPFYHVDKLNSSIPYLVPRAAELLQDIGHSFFDSLQIKGIPLHKIIVTSVLRSKADVAKLRGHNGNATENSCHLYGTTFDICYNRYKTVEDPEGPARRKVRNDSLKWILSEVLNDKRREERCLVKYEVKQGCFHITVK